MIQQHVWPKTELPCILQPQILSSLRQTWSEGFISEDEIVEWERAW